MFTMTQFVLPKVDKMIMMFNYDGSITNGTVKIVNDSEDYYEKSIWINDQTIFLKDIIGWSYLDYDAPTKFMFGLMKPKVEK